MKYYYYIYSIDFLNIPNALLLDEGIFLYPNKRVNAWSEKNRNKFDFPPKFKDSFQFNLSSSSYLLIRKDVEADIAKLEKKIHLIITILSVIVSNQLYFHENYYLILENEKEIVIKRAEINRIQKFLPKVISNMVIIDYLYFQANFKQILKKFSENRISNYLQDIISGLLLSLNEENFSIKLSVAWNTLEHLANRYWKNTDESKLYIIKEDKFKDFIKEMKSAADLFLTNEEKISKDDVNIEEKYRDKWKYKDLLKSQLTDNITSFSPIRYKIRKMFENESINIDDELVQKVKKMRDMIFHKGFNPDDIESKINGNPKDVLMRFIFTIYEKILRFSGIIDEFAESYGDQLLFHNFYNNQEKVKEEIDKIIVAERDNANKNILKKIETIHTKLEDIGEREIDVQFKWKNIEQNLAMVINKDLTKVYLPQGFTEEYFDFLVQNSEILIDSEERKFDIEYPSLRYELNNLTIFFKVTSISNKTGNVKKKANLDIEIVMDIFNTIEHYDRAVLISGDGDFERVLKLLKAKGKQFTVIATDNFIARELREVAGRHYINLAEIKSDVIRT